MRLNFDRAVSAKALHFAFPSGQVVLKDFNLSVEPGSLVCVVGPSGVGKSTLLYCLAGVLPADGTVELMGHRFSSVPDQRAALRLAHCGFIFQRGELLPELTVVENVGLPLQLQGMARRAALAESYGALERFGLGGCADRTPDEISGGQAQRASVARALIHRPSIVFADEPTASLDEESRAVVLVALREAVDRGAAVVCASHDPTLIGNADVRVDLREDSLATAATA